MDENETPTPAEETPEGGEGRTFSQEDVNRFLAEEKRKIQSRYADVDELREKAQYWDEIEQASKTEYERAQEELTRWQTEAERWRSAAVSSRVERLAADRFADPSDALAAIDPAKYLGAGGEIDEAAIQADLDAVLERKPHWRRPTESGPAAPRIPARNPAQGSGANGSSSASPADELAAILRAQLGT